MATIRTPIKLAQQYISDTQQQVYTSPQNTTTQIVEIWLANTDSLNDINVKLYAHGTTDQNLILPNIDIEMNGTVVISDCKIILEQQEFLAAEQDIQAKIVITQYGVTQEEVIE